MNTSAQEDIRTDHSSISERTAALLGAVAIGRNEGERLIRCLHSFSKSARIVYVDSGSTDNSVSNAANLGADVVKLDTHIPFTAARARNAGFKRLLKLMPEVKYVQFIDGDCELTAGWCDAAVSFLEASPDVAAVCGILREREPERSIYNWLCHQEWNGPIGEIAACAGNVMHRSAALAAAGGYREDVIAAEEDELCFRLRAANWRLWRLDREMAVHDAAMTRFSQWWRRSMRAGYAFAQGAALHGASPERYFVKQRRRALLWGVLIPIAGLAATLVWGRVGLLAFGVYPLQTVRLIVVGTGALADRAKQAFFHVLARFPEGLGLLRFERDRWLRRDPSIIEHK
jgi:glycosyltransferase involved in cell wall biosynthesis